jgi:hypothetical protein
LARLSAAGSMCSSERCPISMSVNGEDYGSDKIPISAPLIFSANDCLDIGICLGGPVFLDYSDRAPFPFNAQIDTVNIRYTS